jgi:hypothetical protein
MATLTWVKEYGSGYFSDIQETTDGGYIVVGNTISFGPGGNDYLGIETQ